MDILAYIMGRGRPNERVAYNPGYAHEGEISAFSVVTRSVTVGKHWTKNNLTHDPPQSGARA
jgi:hypothetical protein